MIMNKPLVAALAVAVLSASPAIAKQGKSQGAANGQPFQALQQQIDANLSLIQANEGDISALQDQTAALLSAVDGLDVELSDLESRVSTNEDALVSVNAELDGIDGSLVTLFDEVSQLAAQHQADIDDIQSQIDGLSSDVAANTAALAALSAELAAKVQQLNAAIGDNTLAIDALTTDLTLLNAQVTLLSQTLSNANQAIAALEVRASAHEAEIEALMLRVTTVEHAVANHDHGGVVDLTDVELSYESEGRDVHIFKTPQAAVLADHVTYCEDRGLNWWAPTSSTDAQLLLDNARAIDNYHTWVQVYGVVTTTGNPATINGFAIAPDGPSCVAGSSSGWAGVRDWACSMCDPDGANNSGNTGLSYCWDTSHQYDWFACQE